MASSGQYAAFPNNGTPALLTSLESSYTAPTTTQTALTSGASGTRLNRIVAKAVATTVAGKIMIFLYDGTTYHLFDEFDVTAVTISTTVDGFRLERAYQDVVLKTGWSVKVASSVAQTGIKVMAFGGDL